MWYEIRLVSLTLWFFCFCLFDLQPPSPKTWNDAAGRQPPDIYPAKFYLWSVSFFFSGKVHVARIRWEFPGFGLDFASDRRRTRHGPTHADRERAHEEFVQHRRSPGGFRRTVFRSGRFLDGRGEFPTKKDFPRDINRIIPGFRFVSRRPKRSETSSTNR